MRQQRANERAAHRVVGLVVETRPETLSVPALTELRETVSDIVTGIDPQLSIHDLRIVPGDTHTNVLFDLAFPAGYTGDTDAVMAEMCRFVTGQNPNYSCIIKLEQSYAAVPQSPK